MHPFQLCWALTIIFLLFSCDNNSTNEKIIDTRTLEENRLYYYTWFDSTYVVFKPSPAFLLNTDNSMAKNANIVDPPETIARDRYPVKIFLLEKVAGHVVFPYQKWHRYQLPCANLLLFLEPFTHKGTTTSAGFRCNLSVDEFWNDHLVFDMNGRSQSSQMPDLYVPLHYQTDSSLVIGVNQPAHTVLSR
ncbi:hypothetical protein [Teredinibacter purpureus]|uniref:hypothetical protein n=1 Tax=Teredinibacter purpureus TaxID=2731756 RepID=UPI0005F77FE9|nr:hypothetical protein [Teredinibacter purpureus]